MAISLSTLCSAIARISLVKWQFYYVSRNFPMKISWSFFPRSEISSIIESSKEFFDPI